MLLTGLENGGLLAWERWGCVPIQWRSLKKKKKVRFDHKTTSQRGVSDCIWCQPRDVWCCAKHILMLTKQAAAFLPVLTIKLCFWHCYYTNQENTVASEKTPEFAIAKKWQSREVAGSHMTVKSVWLWSSFFTTQAVTSFVISNAR